MKVMVPLANGFEDIEAITVIDVLRRAGIGVDVVGVIGSMITSKHGITVMTDKKISDVKPDEYDGIILPGGDPGYRNLERSKLLIDILKNLNGKGKLIGAICAAPSILARHGILEKKKATIHPGMENELPYPRGERVVVDGNVITSQAPGTAIEFSLKIVEILAGKEKASALRRSLVV